MRLIARIDLSRLARHLRDTDRHPKLVKAIDRAAAAGSIREDLRSALRSLEQIDRILDRHTTDRCAIPKWIDDPTVSGALFVQAVVLYARATSTTGDRQPLLGEAKLTSEERATHDEAMGFRNGAIAHFGRGETFTDGPLVKEAVVLSLYRFEGQTKKQIGVYTTRALHKVAFSARLSRLIKVRLAEIDERYQRLFNMADGELEAAVKDDVKLGRFLPSFEFDIDAFCGSPDAADQMRMQLDGGSVGDMDYAVTVPKRHGHE